MIETMNLKKILTTLPFQAEAECLNNLENMSYHKSYISLR